MDPLLLFLLSLFSYLEIAQTLTQALHFNTFGGNPMACAIGSAVLDVSWLMLVASFVVVYYRDHHLAYILNSIHTNMTGLTCEVMSHAANSALSLWQEPRPVSEVDAQMWVYEC